MENTIANSGFGLGLLSCGAGGLGRAPAFTSDINNQPQTCLDADGNPIGAGAYSEVDLAEQESEDAADGACDTGLRSPVRQRLRRNARGDLHARHQQLLLPESEHRRAHRRRQVRPHDLRDGVGAERHADVESRQHAVQGRRHLRREESVEGLFVSAHGAAEEALLRCARGERRVHARAFVLGAGHHEQHRGVELQVRPRALRQSARREHGHLAVRHPEQGVDRGDVHGAVEDVDRRTSR